VVPEATKKNKEELVSSKPVSKNTEMAEQKLLAPESIEKKELQDSQNLLSSKPISKYSEIAEQQLLAPEHIEKKELQDSQDSPEHIKKKGKQTNAVKNKEEVIELLGSDSEEEKGVGSGKILPFSQVDVEYSDLSPLREISQDEYDRADQYLHTIGPKEKAVADNPYLKLGSLKQLATPPKVLPFEFSQYWLTDESVNNYLTLLSRRDKKLSDLDTNRGQNYFFKSSFYTHFVPLEGDW